MMSSVENILNRSYPRFASTTTTTTATVQVITYRLWFSNPLIISTICMYSERSV